jgi:hypothetical protein
MNTGSDYYFDRTGQRHELPAACRIRIKDVLSGLHHEYWLEEIAAGDWMTFLRSTGISGAVTARETGNTVFGAGSPLTARRTLPRSASKLTFTKGGP